MLDVRSMEGLGADCVAAADLEFDAGELAAETVSAYLPKETRCYSLRCFPRSRFSFGWVSS